MSTIDKVEAKIQSFIRDKELFTSVDIANAMKRDGVWVKNRDVAKFLRNYDFSRTGYTKDKITVANGDTATLYLPAYSNPAHYNKTSQKALTPKEVNIGLKTPTVAPVAIVRNPATERVISCTGKRIKIGAAYITKLGWHSGDKVDASKIDAGTVIDKLSPRSNFNLKVNKDGRLSFATNFLKPGLTELKVGVANGKLYLKA